MSIYSRNNSLSMRRKNNMAITAQTPCSSTNNAPTSVEKGISCSTPEPHREASSPCESDSEAASPVPFLCTQDGSYGETEVIWNYYTPNRARHAPAAATTTTPLSRKSKIKYKSKIGQLQPKQKPLRETHKKTPIFQDLLQELNRNIQGIIERSQKPTQAKEECGSEEDMFGCSSPERSPSTRVDAFPRSSSRCLRKNLLSSKFSRPESDTALESDDSMNECLVRASQMVEERVFCAKRNGVNDDCDASAKKCKIEQDSMDNIFNNITMESPGTCRKDIVEAFTNDSFDNFVGNLNDSAIERLTQLPIINESPRHNGASNKGKTNNFTNKNVKVEECDSPSFASQGNSAGWTIKELIAMDSLPAGRSSFARHSSMPESPSACAPARPSTSGTALCRHSSMPGRREGQDGTSSDDSTPIRCTPDEIKKKHQQAREKLLAKRLFPLSSTQHTQHTQQTQEPKESVEISTRPVPKFQPKVPSRNGLRLQALEQKTANMPQSNTGKATVQTSEIVKAQTNSVDLKSIIEKKRKEALNKLKLKRSQNNVP